MDFSYEHSTDRNNAPSYSDAVKFKPYPVQQYIAVPSNTNPPSADGADSFLNIIGASPVDVIEQLITENPSVIGKKGFNGLSPLHRACLRGDVSLVKLLLKHGAKPEMPNDFDETPLHYACRRANVAIMRLLLEHGADLKAEDKAGKGAMHHAAHGGGIIAMHYLLEVCGLSPHVRDRNLSTPMHIVAMHGHIEAFNYLLKNERSDLLSRDAQGNTVMHIAASNGNGWMCWRIMETIGYMALHELNGEDCTPLDLAKRGALPQYTEVVKLLSFYMRHSSRFSAHRRFLGVGPAWYGLLALPFVIYAVSLLVSHLFVNQGPSMFIGVMILLLLRAFHSHRMNHVSRMPSPAHAGLFASGMLYTTLCFYVVILPAVHSDLGMLFITLSVVALLTMLYMYWKLLTVDPGLCRQPQTKPQSGQFYTVDDIAAGYPSQDNFCTVCEIIPQKWTSHCKLCNRCYLYVDHHCLYLYRCIAANNHRLFIVFNFVVMASMLMFVYSCVVYLGRFFPNQSLTDWSVLKQIFAGHACVWSLFVLNAISLCWCSWLIKMQLQGVGSGQVLSYNAAGNRKFVPIRQQLQNIVQFLLHNKLPYAASQVFPA